MMMDVLRQDATKRKARARQERKEKIINGICAVLMAIGLMVAMWFIMTVAILLDQSALQ